MIYAYEKSIGFKYEKNKNEREQISDLLKNDYITFNDWFSVYGVVPKWLILFNVFF